MPEQGHYPTDEPDAQVRSLYERRRQVVADLHESLDTVKACREELKHIDASICAIWDGKPAPTTATSAKPGSEPHTDPRATEMYLSTPQPQP